MNAPFGVFDEVVFRCRSCGEIGEIRSVALNCTRVGLIGHCGSCGRQSTVLFDLLEIQNFLTDGGSPPGPTYVGTQVSGIQSSDQKPETEKHGRPFLIRKQVGIDKRQWKHRRN